MNALDVNKIRSTVKITSYDHDPDATTATDVAWVPMKNLYGILFQFFRTVGVSDLTMKVLANAESDGSGTDYVVKTKTLTGVQPNAVGDYTFMEILQSEVAQLGSENGVDLAYVSLNLTLATATDEGVVSYISLPNRFSHDDLTDDYITT